MSSRVVQSDWFRTRNGTKVQRITLRNALGMEADVSTWGATLTSLRVPVGARDVEMGDLAEPPPLVDLLLGWAYPPVWEDNPTYFGSTVGRFANRIAHGRFELGGRDYALPPNLLPHHLHGGRRGFSHQAWKVVDPVPGSSGPARGVAPTEDESSVSLRLRSPDGDEGYPGNLDVLARYTLDDGGTLAIEYRAETDAPTHVNLTNHAYFNLSGTPLTGTSEQAAGTLRVHRGEALSPDPTPSMPSVLDHELTVAARHFTEVDHDGIPTGRIVPVTGTPLDFTRPVRLGDHLPPRHPLLRAAGGYDHNLVLSREGRLPDGSVPAAVLTHPPSGRSLVVHTTLPGVQVYTSNGMKARGGTAGLNYGRFAGVCLETQFFPDTPNHPDFPSTLVVPGVPWSHRTSFTLRTDRI